MPRRNRNVDVAQGRTPLELLTGKAARRANAKARRKGRAA